MSEISKDIYLGIDPGKNGGICFLNESGEVVDVVDIKKHSLHDLNGKLSEYSSRIIMCVLEQVSAMPGQGVTSMFSFGEIYGQLQGLIVGNNIPFELFTPRSWQKFLRIKKKEKGEGYTAFKRRLKAEAQRLFPDEKVINNTADAYLIAEFCRRKFGKNFTE